MSIRHVAAAVGGFGLATVLAIAVGLGTLAGLMALVQLGFMVGSPMALVLQRSLRSWPVSAVISSVVSLALSALAAQSLVWFEFATPVTLVTMATLYGLCLAWLMETTLSTGSERSDAERSAS